MKTAESTSIVPSASGPFDTALQEGLRASRADDVGTALTAWAQAAALDPSSALPHFLMGAELAQAGQRPDAEDALARAVSLAPGFEVARFQLGLLQFTMDRLALANVTWEPLLHGHGGPFGLFVKAFAALAREDIAEAASLFELGMAANTKNAPLNRDVARVLVTIQSRRPEVGGLTTLEPALAEGSHVLLAAYRQQGLTH